MPLDSSSFDFWGGLLSGSLHLYVHWNDHHEIDTEEVGDMDLIIVEGCKKHDLFRLCSNMRVDDLLSPIMVHVCI